MRRLAALLSPLAFAGCVTPTPPTYVLEQGQRYEFASAVAPRRLASCASANARSFSDRYTSEVDELVRPDTFQVVVRRTRNWHYEPIVVGHAAPAPGGSQIVLYVSAALGSTERDDWVERLRRGCDIQIRADSAEPMPARVIIVPADTRPAPLRVPPAPAGRGTRG